MRRAGHDDPAAGDGLLPPSFGRAEVSADSGLSDLELESAQSTLRASVGLTRAARRAGR